MINFKTIISFLSALVVCINTSCSEDVRYDTFVSYKLPYNLSVDVEDEVAVVVSNQKEFDRLFGDIKGILKKIDFNNYSLLYVQGKSKNYIADIHSLWKQEDLSYHLEITVDNNYCANEYREWCLGFVIQKHIAENVDAKVYYTCK